MKRAVHMHQLWESLRRLSVLAALLFVCLPSAVANAAVQDLTSRLLLADLGACFSNEAALSEMGASPMSPDPRVLQMSPDGRALQRLAQHLDAPPCAPSDQPGDQALCVRPPEPDLVRASPGSSRFLSAPRPQDIVPVRPLRPASCSVTPDGVSQCEQHPPPQQQLSLDLIAMGALLPALRPLSHAPELRATLALAPISTRLLGASEGFPRGPDLPPRA